YRPDNRAQARTQALYESDLLGEIIQVLAPFPEARIALAEHFADRLEEPEDPPPDAPPDEPDDPPSEPRGDGPLPPAADSSAGPDHTSSSAAPISALPRSPAACCRTAPPAQSRRRGRGACAADRR